MKKTIKTFVGRLRDAWAIIRGRNYVFIRENEDTSEQEALHTAIFILGARWLKNNDNVNCFSRVDMLLDLLNDTNSIMMLAKADQCITRQALRLSCNSKGVRI